MSGMTTANSTLLTRAEIWSSQLKETLKEDLMATTWVDFLTEFPDGTTFTIPSIGTPIVDNYAEDEAVVYRPIDTGEWQFTISEYLSSGTYVTRKAEQDAFYMSQLVSTFVPEQHRAIMNHFEANVLALPNSSYAANAQATINGRYHRMSGGNAGKIELADFAYAKLALQKANVPMTNLVAIVDPAVGYYLDTLTNIVSVANNPMWEGIVADGISTGMKFTKNIYGFDVYVSNMLPDVADNALPEKDGSTTNDFSSTNGKANYFFSAAPGLSPWKAAWRQEPTVDAEWNKDYQRTEFVTTARYGTGFYRPENMVNIVSSTAV